MTTGKRTAMLGSAALSRALEVNRRVREHQVHLEALGRTLKALGLADAAVNQHIMEIFEGYKAELLRTVNHMQCAGVARTRPNGHGK